MAVIGLNFTKMSVEKKENAKGKLSIKNDVALKDVKKEAFVFGDSKRDGLKFVFNFVTNYNVDNDSVATIDLVGEIIAIEKPEIVKSILAQWKKDKKLDVPLMASVLNHALSKSYVQALLLSKELSLPSPMPLPRVNISKEKASKYVA